MADTSKAKARPYGREAVKKALIEAAAPLIAKHGVEGITTRSIAKAARVNHGLINRHFGSKDTLVREVARSLARRLFEESQARHDDIATMLDRGFSAQSGRFVRSYGSFWTPKTSTRPSSTKSFPARSSSGCEARTGAQARGIGQASTVKLYLIAVLIFGGEVVDPSIRRSLKLNEKTFEKLRRQAMKLVLTRI